MNSRLQGTILLTALVCCATSLSLVSPEIDARGGGRGGARASVHGGGHAGRPPGGRPAGGVHRPPGGGGRPVAGPPGGGGGARPPAGGPRPPAGGARPPAPPPPGRYWNHPVATGVAIATTAAVIGSVIYSLPPSCTKVYVDGLTYQQCGPTWYRPQYAGTSVQYVVVESPY